MIGTSQFFQFYKVFTKKKKISESGEEKRQKRKKKFVSTRVVIFIKQNILSFAYGLPLPKRIPDLDALQSVLVLPFTAYSPGPGFEAAA